MCVSSIVDHRLRAREVLHTLGAFGLCATAIGAAPSAMAGTGDAEPAPVPQPSAAPPKAVSEVVVTGVRPLLGDKLPQSLQNTPQSVTVVSDKLMQAQGVTRLQDALKNVPGITLNAGEGAARGDTVNLRGFSAFNDFFLDGIRDAAVYDRDSFNLQEIEVLKGPSATLFGRGSTGGAINQVSKAASLTPHDTLTAEVGTNDEYRALADLDQPFGPAAAFRLNAMGERSAVADRDDVRNRRWGVAPTLAFGIGEPTTLTLAYLHQQEDNVPDVGIPFVNGRPAPVPRNADFGLASDRTTADDDIVTARLKHDFAPNLSIADTLRYARYAFDYQFDAPNFGANPPTASTPLSAVLVGRDAPDSSGVQTNLTEQLDLTARFDTGSLRHVLVTGLELARQTNSLDRYNNPFNKNNNWVPETPLLDPNPNEARPAEPVTAIQDTTAYSEGIYATDTIGIGRHLDLILGLRLDRFAASYNQLTLSSGAVLHLDHVDRVASPHAALVFKPTPSQSYYISYGTSFDPSAEALTLTSKTANLGPVKGVTYEAGAKTAWLNGGLLLTGAVFRTEVDNAQTNDPDNPTITVLNGDQRVQGLELGAAGHLTSKLSINAGYTYLDGETIASGTAAYVGKVMPNLARNAVNLWAEYKPIRAWEIGVGGNYLGKRYADSGETAVVPSYLVWNAMTSYRINPGLKLQLNAINLFDKLYYDGVYYTSAAENHVVPGAGRTVKLTVLASF
jgi:catecholate siderophore receptor